MAYCVPHGIPHSEFLEWDESDQDKALAWLRRQAEKCGSCGTLPDSWIDDEGKQKNDPPLEVASIRCFGCEALANAQEEAPEKRRYIWNWRLPKRR